MPFPCHHLFDIPRPSPPPPHTGCYMFMANCEGRAGIWAHLKIIWSAYFWNLVGSLLIVGLELGSDTWKGREVSTPKQLSLNCLDC